MIAIRPLPREALERIREIDRSEHLTEQYAQRGGRLEKRAVDIPVSNWAPTGSDEHSIPHWMGVWGPILEAGGTLLGALDGERLAGFAIYEPRLAEDMGNLSALYVSRGHRRLGVATGLVDETIRLARADGAQRLYVSATPSGSTIDFYLGCGFAPTEDPHPRMLAKEPEDIHMILELRTLARRSWYPRTDAR